MTFVYKYGRFVKAEPRVRIDGTYSSDPETNDALKLEIGARISHALNERRVTWVSQEDMDNLVFDYLGYRYRVTERVDKHVKAVTRLGMVAAPDDDGEEELLPDTTFKRNDALGESWGAW